MNIKMKGGVLIRRTNIEELDWITINPSLKLYKSFCSEYSFNDRNRMDFEWIERQLDYVYNLTQYQKDILYSYTKYGDKIVNNYLRNTLTDAILEQTIESIQRNRNHPFILHNLLDFTTKNTLLSSIHTYSLELEQIILNAPKLKIPIKAFRGIKDINYIGNTNTKTTTHEFISSSLYLPSTEMFMNDNCCLLELSISPEIPCLFIASVSKEPGEYEILITKSVKMTVLNSTLKKFLDIPAYTLSKNIFDVISNYELDEKRVFECIVTN